MLLAAQCLTWMASYRPPALRRAWQVERAELEMVTAPLSRVLNKMIDRLPDAAKRSVGEFGDIISLIAGMIGLSIIIKERENELAEKFIGAQGATGAGARTGAPGGSGSNGVSGRGGANPVGGGAAPAAAGDKQPSPVPLDPETIKIAFREGLA